MDYKTFPNAIEYIHSLGRFSGAPGLHRIAALCAVLGNPQDSLRFIHIAGTNGKGSTACMLASALQEAGCRTGLYTSPFLVSFHERIRVNGEMIPDEALTRLTIQTAEAARRLSLPEGETIGEFEFTTALAFLYFSEQNCDIVVLETGLGGRFDATNVIQPPEVCVITPISLDHTAVLGKTTAAIAGEKAGIIKPTSAVISAYGQPEDAENVIRQAAASVGAVFFEGAEETKLLRSTIDGSAFVYENQGYTLSMPGRHQLQNAVTALRALSALRQRGWAIPVEAAVHGLARARMAGRLEKAVDRPLVLLDGAHNPAGTAALCSALDEYLKMRQIHVIMGMVRDKDYATCVHAVAKRADVFYACSPNAGERALDEHTLAALAKQNCAEVHTCHTLEHALATAFRNAAPEDCILVCGSLYLVGEAKKLF